MNIEYFVKVLRSCKTREHVDTCFEWYFNICKRLTREEDLIITECLLHKRDTMTFNAKVFVKSSDKI